MTYYHDDGRYPKEIVVLMAKGKSNAEICSYWDISEKTMEMWLSKHQIFRDAYDRGLAKRDAFILGKIKERWEKGDDSGIKHLERYLSRGYKWKDESQDKITKNTQINIGNIQVIDSQSRLENIRHVQDILKGNPILEAQLIEDKSENSDGS